MTFRIDDAQGGRYVLRVAGTDRFGNPIVADRAIYVSGKKDETKLRLLADRQRYKVGEEASVNLHSRGRAGTALLTWEADRILTYKLVTREATATTRSPGPIDGPQFPNFTLTAARMWENKFDEAKLDVQVERDLRVTVAPAKPLVGPGEPVELEVTTVDQLGRPVSAELSIAMVDQSLLAALRRPHAADRRRSSTTRRAPGPSRPRRPTRSATRRRPSRWPRRSSRRPSGLAAVAANAADRARSCRNSSAGRSSLDGCRAASRRSPPAAAGSRRREADEVLGDDGRHGGMGGMGGRMGRARSRPACDGRRSRCRRT